MYRIYDTIDFIYRLISSPAKRFFYKILIPALVSDRIQLIRITRLIVQISILSGFFMLLSAIVFRSPKFLNGAGLIFDFAGISRIFISDEWDDLIEKFTDEKKFPSGPPSRITREMFFDDDPELFSTSEDNAKLSPTSEHLYYNRGLFFIGAGFILQLISTILS